VFKTIFTKLPIDPCPKWRRPIEGGLETGGIVCLHQESQRSISAIFCPLKMQHNCFVPFCNGTSKKSKNLRFHRFPKKRELKDQWIAKIRRDEGDYFTATENTNACSE